MNNLDRSCTTEACSCCISSARLVLDPAPAMSQCSKCGKGIAVIHGTTARYCANPACRRVSCDKCAKAMAGFGAGSCPHCGQPTSRSLPSMEQAGPSSAAVAQAQQVGVARSQLTELTAQTSLQRQQLAVQTGQLAVQANQLVVQAAHLNVSTAQLDQLSGIKDQMAAQTSDAQRQALLAQRLFDVEEAVERLTVVAGSDPFAAGVLAHQWLAAVSGVTVQEFHSVENKRAWASANKVLVALWRQLETDPTQRSRAEQFLSALDHRRRWQSPPHAVYDAACRALQEAHGSLTQLQQFHAQLIANRTLLDQLLDLVRALFSRPTKSWEIAQTWLKIGPWQARVATLEHESRVAYAQLMEYEAWAIAADGGALIVSTLEQHPSLAA